ncbi:hypothetical protein [Alteromonas gilva]|uniref:Uncharacterized protein n=1 Tax=Alteromonas gilva TaxID=2987522 RepID=A0ABT5L8R9_9ALTE|nr:hypothetical protein [Alteromonas gilva]MDC8832881.1 hypothetical protein [Alteromonas gilva]
MDLLRRFNEQFSRQSIGIIDRIGAYVVSDIALSLGQGATKERVINVLRDKNSLIALHDDITDDVLKTRLSTYINSDESYFKQVTALPVAVLKQI